MKINFKDIQSKADGLFIEFILINIFYKLIFFAFYWSMNNLNFLNHIDGVLLLNLIVFSNYMITIILNCCAVILMFLFIKNKIKNCNKNSISYLILIALIGLLFLIDFIPTIEIK